MQGGGKISTGKGEEETWAVLCKWCSIKQTIGQATKSGKEKGAGELGEVEARQLQEDAWQEQLAKEKEREKQRWKEKGRRTKEREDAERRQREMEEEAGISEKRRSEEAKRIYKRLKRMRKERDEVATRVLANAEMPAEEAPTMELAKEIEAMPNGDRESEVRNYAMRIYTPIRNKQKEEGATAADAKLAFERRIRAAVGTWTAAGEIHHVDRTEKPKNAQEKKEQMERKLEKKAREDVEAAERLARTVATAFGMAGGTRQSKASPFPKLEVRKAILKAGKGKVTFQVRAVHREIEQYNDTRSQKKVLHDRVDRITNKIVALEQGAEDTELADLWARWDRGI